MATSNDLLIKQRSVIEFLAAEECSAANIHARMKTVESSESRVHMSFLCAFISTGFYSQLLRDVGGTVVSESVLRSAGTLLSRVRAPMPAPWHDGGPKSVRSPCELAIQQPNLNSCEPLLRANLSQHSLEEIRRNSETYQRLMKIHSKSFRTY
ncbi:hypothetical protein PoB_007443200 [Plakobranchus ocellatus]|uniref:Uncharacterized protein n=1 Tax=Plakobranchus ocellatus TaxID=259542 RepID=A0AAV4DUD6_9GAST|nr:hypothetical protein PoB_007443200 [Plakobranchus ocellatus]